MKKLFDYDPHTKIKEVFHGNGDGSFAIEQIQDCASIVKYNKECQADTSRKQRGIKEDMYHIARIPVTVLMEWKKKYNLDWNRAEDLPKIEKLLSSNEYRYLRTVDKI